MTAGPSNTVENDGLAEEMAEQVGHDGDKVAMTEVRGADSGANRWNGDVRRPGEGAVTPKAAGRSLFDDVTGQAEGRGRKRRSCDVQRPGRPRFHRLSEGTASPLAGDGRSVPAMTTAKPTKKDKNDGPADKNDRRTVKKQQK